MPTEVVIVRMNALRAGVEGTVIAGKLLEKTEEESLGGRLGYNAATDVFEDLVAVGVIDPVKVLLHSQACFGQMEGSRVLNPRSTCLKLAL